MSEVATPPGAAPATPPSAPTEAPAAPAGTTPAPAPERASTGSHGTLEAKLGDAPAPTPGGPERGPDGRFVARGGDAPAEPPPPPRKFRVKDGEEEFEVDEDEVVRGYQRARAANRRFEEAARARKELEAREAQIRTALARGAQDPESLLRAAGVDPDAYVQARLRALVEEESLPEHERGRRALERDRAEFEAQRRAHQEAQARAEYEAQVRHHQETFQREIPAALKAAGLPDRGYAATRMVDLIQAHLAVGAAPDFRAIAAQVRAEFDEDMSGWAGSLDDARIRALVGEERLAKIRAADLAKLAPPTATPRPAAAPPEPPRRVRWEDWTPEHDAAFRRR